MVLHKFALLSILMCIFLPTFAFANYADIYVIVDEMGKTTIEGIASTDILSENSHFFTSKKHDIWTLNITDLTFYSSLSYEIHFPKYSSIQFLDSTTKASISVEDNHPVVSGFGLNDSLSIIVQYKIKEEQNLNIQAMFIILGSIILLLLAVVAFKRKKHTPENQNNILLSGRQKTIYDTLKKHGPMNAKKLNSYINIPKSSLSRNIQSLVNKDIIVSKQQGLSTILSVLEKKD